VMWSCAASRDECQRRRTTQQKMQKMMSRRLTAVTDAELPSHCLQHNLSSLQHETLTLQTWSTAQYTITVIHGGTIISSISMVIASRRHFVGVESVVIT